MVEIKVALPLEGCLVCLCVRNCVVVMGRVLDGKCDCDYIHLVVQAPMEEGILMRQCEQGREVSHTNSTGSYPSQNNQRVFSHTGARSASQHRHQR